MYTQFHYYLPKCIQRQCVSLTPDSIWLSFIFAISAVWWVSTLIWRMHFSSLMSLRTQIDRLLSLTSQNREQGRRDRDWLDKPGNKWVASLSLWLKTLTIETIISRRRQNIIALCHSTDRESTVLRVEWVAGWVHRSVNFVCRSRVVFHFGIYCRVTVLYVSFVSSHDIDGDMATGNYVTLGDMAP